MVTVTSADSYLRDKGDPIVRERHWKSGWLYIATISPLTAENIPSREGRRIMLDPWESGLADYQFILTVVIRAKYPLLPKLPFA